MVAPIDFPPPSPADAERMVCGAMLRSPELCAADVFSRCHTDDFADHCSAVVFAACRSLWDRFALGGVADVYADLCRRRDRGDPGCDLGRDPAGVLLGMWESTPTAVNAAWHANLVRAAADRRRAAVRLRLALADLADGRDAGEVLAEVGG